MRILVLWLLWLLLLMAWPVMANGRLLDYQAEYSLLLNGFKVGELQRSLQRQANGDYLSQTLARTTGLASWFKPDVAIERSEWRLVDGWPRPLLYTYEYSGQGKDVLERLEFDWTAGIVHSLNKGQLTSINLESRVLDNQVFEVAMRRAIADGVKAHIYQIAQRDRIVDYDFAVIGTDELYIRTLGKLSTLKIQRGNTVLWLAPEQDYLVVKIEQKDGRSTATSYLTGLSR